MEINETTQSITFLCQLFGFAPYKIIRDKMNRIVNFQLSYGMCFYSLVLITFFGVSSNVALYYDLYSGHAVRMKTVTLRVVFVCDINTVSISLVSNIIASLFAVENVRQINILLKKIDKDLFMFDSPNSLHNKRTARKITLITYSIFVLFMILLANDFYAWLRMAQKLQLKEKHSNFMINVYALIPLYCMYCAIVPLHAKFYVTMHRIGLRYRKLNEIIQNYDAFDHNQSEDIVQRIMRIHDSLTTVLSCESSEFGVTILILIISCLFHLILVLYYILTEVLAAYEYYFAVIHWFWVIFHFTQLMFIIEPCHMVFIEAKKTTKYVCDLMYTKNDTITLNNFWKKLMSQNVCFSACGICQIDRRILISIAASVTTYLVILLQFHH